MKHIFLIDPIEKLNVKKDSSLFWALSLKQMGHEVYLLYMKNFYVNNLSELPVYSVSSFEGKISADLYIEYISIIDTIKVNLHPGDCMYMRLDPPFDENYIHALWMLQMLEKNKVRVSNSPHGILLYQEKLVAYQLGPEVSIPSFIGHLGPDAAGFLNDLRAQGFKDFIIKPLNSFSGIGVYKFNEDDHLEEYIKNKQEVKDCFILQPFVEKIYDGEVRSIFWRGKEIGSILKKPKEGTFLANISQGGRFSVYHLEDIIRKRCEKLSLQLLASGVELVAYDILDGKISEVNVTCPGLLVEVSHALQRNIVAENMIN